MNRVGLKERNHLQSILKYLPQDKSKRTDRNNIGSFIREMDEILLRFPMATIYHFPDLIMSFTRCFSLGFKLLSLEK